MNKYLIYPLFFLVPLVGIPSGVFANIEIPSNIPQSESSIPESQIARYFDQAFQQCASNEIFIGYDSGATHSIKCRTHQSIKDELDLGTYPASCPEGQTAYGVTENNRFLLCKKARTNVCGLSESEAMQLNTAFTSAYRGRYYSLTADQWCETTILQADSQSLIYVPNALSKLKKLTFLDLSYNQLTSIPNLGKMWNLQTLRINNNLLTSLPSDTGNLKKLNPVLNLSNNRLTTLPESIGDLTQLTKINISMNNSQADSYWYWSNVRSACSPYGTLISLPDSITKLVNLTEFSAYCSGLGSLPANFGNLNKLNKLDLYSNRLTSLPESFGNLSLLSWSLDLAYNKLTYLPESLGNITNITQIFLEYNQLTTIPSTFKNLRKVSYINLNNNQVNSLPSDLAGMWDESTPWTLCVPWLLFGSCEGFPSLRIDLKYNQLKKIPDGFGQLKKLSHLNLNYNQINQLSDDFGDLTELTFLNLDRNELVHLPASFWWLEKLSNLQLNQNKLIDLPDNFGNLAKLMTLNLSGNKLSQLPDSFVNLVGATEIDLRTNELSELPENIGNIWSKLTKLLLYGNKISTLPDSIGSLSNLIELDLGYNQLSALPSSINKLAKLWKLQVGSNQISSLPEDIGSGSLGTQPQQCYDYTGLWWGIICSNVSVEINLGNNLLTTLPESFSNINIWKLNLSSNQLEKLPNSIGNLSGKMTALSLGWNPKLKSLAGTWDGSYWSGFWSQNEPNMTQDGSPVKISWWGKVIIEVGLLACDLRKSEVDGLNILTWENKTAEEWCTGTTKVNLSWKNLSTLPSALTKLKNITELDLSYNNFVSYQSLPTVTKLNLSHNKIQYGRIESSGCQWIPSEVDLSHNLLTEFRWWWNGSAECFLLKPIKLNLSNNQIKFIQAKSGQGGGLTIGEWYTGYSTIIYGWATYLDYSNNQITSISDRFAGYTNLQRLNLSGNPWLGDIAQDFVNGSWSVIAFQDTITPNDKTITIRTSSDGSPIKITADTSFVNECGITEAETQELNETLYGDPIYYGASYKSARQLCALTSIGGVWRAVLPESFGKLKNLEYFSHGGSYIAKISSLPESFGNLTKLKYLYLNDNVLERLPDSFGNLINLQSLDLRRNQLQSLPENFWNLSNLSSLELSGNLLQKLPDSFGNLTQTTQLNLSNNRLIQLPDSFGNLKIRDLNLDSNPIQVLPESFGNLTYLATIRMVNTAITELPESFGNLNSLTEMIADNTPISDLSVNFGNLTNLRRLSLQNSRNLTELPSTFWNLTSLQWLYLQNSNITTLPSGMWGLLYLSYMNIDNNQLRSFGPDFWPPRLIQLSAKNNKLTSLPDSFTGMTSIQYIELQNNQLTSLGKFLPERSCVYGWFGGCYYISNLNVYLENNQLASLPENIGKMGITYISLHHNKLTTLPESFGQSMYYATQIMDLSYNKLVTLPESFSGFVFLKTLDLTNNELTRLPRDFGKLENLETLKLYTNQIAFLPDSFGNLAKLKTLDLFSNKLGTLPASFGNLTNLEDLDLGANRISSLPDVFGNIKKIRYLKLHQNQLQEIPPSITQMTQLIWITLSNNQLTKLPEWLSNLSNLIDLNIKNNPTLTQLPASFADLTGKLTDLDAGNTWLGSLAIRYDTYSSMVKSQDAITSDAKKITITSQGNGSALRITKE